MAFLARTGRTCGLFARAGSPAAAVLAAHPRPAFVIAARQSVTKAPVRSTHQSHAAERLLPQQRLKRPLSPHLSIYRWQITSIPSTLTRITGVAMSGSFYLFGMLYLASPWLGLDLSSASLAASFGALPPVAKVLIKFTLAWPLAFHAFNGIRYLLWDMTIGINNKQVARTGWAAVYVSFASALALALLV